jgi:hypothetical protein
MSVLFLLLHSLFVLSIFKFLSDLIIGSKWAELFYYSH